MRNDAENSILPANWREAITVYSEEEFGVALNLGHPIRLGRPIGLTRPHTITRSVTMVGAGLSKNAAFGGPMLTIAIRGAGAAELRIDRIGLGANGAGRLIVSEKGRFRLEGFSRQRCMVGDYGYHDNASGTAVEIADGPSRIIIGGGRPRRGGAGDVLHYSGGRGHVFDAADILAYDDAVAIMPRLRQSPFGYRSIADVRGTMRNCVSTHARALAFGIPIREQFGNYTGTVSGITIRAQNLVGHRDGQLTERGAAVVAVLCPDWLPNNRVRRFEVAVDGLNAAGSPYAVRVNRATDGVIRLANARGWSDRLGHLDDTNRVRIETLGRPLRLRDA